MASSTPTLASVLLGGGFVGAVTFMTKGVLDVKEERIRYLVEEKNDLEKKIAVERERAGKFLSDFKEQIKGLDSGTVDIDVIAQIREHLNEAENWFEEFAECETVAAWIESQKEDWIQASVRHSCKKCKINLWMPYQVRGFKKDLNQGIEWVQTCLNVYGGHVKTPLSRSIKNLSLSSVEPYKTAITYLIQYANRGNLTSTQREYMEEMLYRLIDSFTEISKA